MTATLQREPTVEDVVALERVAARSWPAVERATVDGWLLRAADGFTRRANSAVPTTSDAVADLRGALAETPGVPPVVARIEAWYRRRGLPPMVALPASPLGPFTDLATRLGQEGWVELMPTLAMTAPLAPVAGAPGVAVDLPAAVVTDHLDDTWLACFDPSGERLSDGARTVIAGGGARFVSLHLDGEVVAIARSVVDGSWVGLSAVLVRPDVRRRGIARHLTRAVAADAAVRGATRAWLQVEYDNTAAIALYQGLGFQIHHEYRYHRGADDGERT